MILKGIKHNNAARGVSYVLGLDGKEENESVKLIGTRGLSSKNPEIMALEMAFVAEVKSPKDPYYHLIISPKPTEKLSHEQLNQAADIALKELGLEGHQAVFAEHIKKDGSQHLHAFINRVNPENLKVNNLSWNYAKHDTAARLMEKDFGLEKVPSVFNREKDEPRPEIGLSQKEQEQARRTGLNAIQWRKEVKEIVAGTDGTAQEIIKALEEKGNIVAKGDKVRDGKPLFILVDPTGGHHRMMQTLGKEWRKDRFSEVFKDIDPSRLPSVAEAQQKQQERRERIEAEKALMQDRAARKEQTKYSNAGMVSQQMDALRDHKKNEKALNRMGAYDEQQKGAIGKEKGHQEQTIGVRSVAEIMAEHRKAVERAKQRRQTEPGNEKTDDISKLGRYSQSESLLKDIAPHLHKKATQEQTGAKRRKEEGRSFESDMKMFMKMAAEADKVRQNSRNKGDGWERERER